MALCSVLGHHTKALAVLDDLVALLQIDQCDLVAIRDVLLCFHSAELLPLAVDNILSGGNFCHASHNIVFFVHEQCVDLHVHSPFDMVTLFVTLQYHQRAV